MGHSKVPKSYEASRAQYMMKYENRWIYLEIVGYETPNPDIKTFDEDYSGSIFLTRIKKKVANG